MVWRCNNNFGGTSMSKDFIKELNAYCIDHFKHFKCYPLEFEYKDRIYKWEEFKKYIRGIQL